MYKKNCDEFHIPGTLTLVKNGTRRGKDGIIWLGQWPKYEYDMSSLKLNIMIKTVR